MPSVAALEVEQPGQERRQEDKGPGALVWGLIAVIVLIVIIIVVWALSSGSGKSGENTGTATVTTTTLAQVSTTIIGQVTTLVGTTTVAGPTTTTVDTVKNPSVDIPFTVANVNYATLTADVDLKTKFEETVRAQVAADAGVEETKVDVSISAGSVHVTATVKCENAAEVVTFGKVIDDGKSTLQTNLIKVLGEVEGIKAATDGGDIAVTVGEIVQHSGATVSACAAPQGITNAGEVACKEGEQVNAGKSCTPVCAENFEATEKELQCSEDGIFSPKTFNCEAAGKGHECMKQAGRFHCPISSSPGACFSKDISKEWACWSAVETKTDAQCKETDPEFEACTYADYGKGETLSDVTDCGKLDYFHSQCNPAKASKPAWGACYTKDSHTNEGWKCIDSDTAESFAKGDCLTGDSTRQYDGFCRLPHGEQEVYACETVTSFGKGEVSLSKCAGNQAACFSLSEAATWKCFPTADDLVPRCTTTAIGDVHKTYDGACLYQSADGYDAAKDYPDGQPRPEKQPTTTAEKPAGESTTTTAETPGGEATTTTAETPAGKETTTTATSATTTTAETPAGEATTITTTATTTTTEAKTPAGDATTATTTTTAETPAGEATTITTTATTTTTAETPAGEATTITTTATTTTTTAAEVAFLK